MTETKDTSKMQTPILWGRGSSSNVQKVIWALHELGIDHHHVEVAGPFGGTDTPDFIAMNPNRTVPVWQTSEITLWESQAILRNLARSNDALYGAGELAMAEVDRWLDWFATVYWPPIRLLFVETFREKSLKPYQPRALETVAVVQAATDLLAGQAAQHDYLAGPDFTIADIAVAIGVNRMLGLDYGISLPPALNDWKGRVTARPGYKHATKGEPDLPGHRHA
ncbi:MAG: glutathione S-transferase family protein [Pseudomonadota bacterium]